MYRISELASIANVSKRTVDYYTNMGLLVAERSKANYRIYHEDAVEDLKFIEHCKSLHIPLEEIKKKLELQKSTTINDYDVEDQISSVSEHMKYLQDEINNLLSILQKMDSKRKEAVSEKLSPESVSLMKSLRLISS
ncbi:MAG TPA: MerR family transcriptional regulator [Bacillus sp. (in: firmicutes)]|uniref:MerR family transcriptional regulator n=1 Tax=Bacillus litorisediminis TaxID=2922713 RepID=UPI001FABBF63|nr:MerR family transcriptional regulator [Bacillus litorisediminis]HWO76768.1 MerR family transcriptional regulator [Bacillus sp. (in: firmicutes)]